MSQLMKEAGAERISVAMKTDVEKFFYWYGPDVGDEDDENTLAQYNDYINTGIYHEAEYYSQK